MNHNEETASKKYISNLKADLEKTLEAYNKATSLRAKKIEQDMEQVKVYLDILEDRGDSIKLNSSAVKKMQSVLAWESKAGRRNSTHRKQQDELEKHFFEVQKVLVGLISKRFKY